VANRQKPTMYMIAGPNGAGKSTLYETRIKPRTTGIPFINADIIQKEELRDPDVSASYKAAQIAEQRRKEHLKTGKSFVAESVFSHESKLDLIHEAKAAGFRIKFFHVNLRSPNLSVKRVESRVKEGGHPVPEQKIRDRYERNQALIRSAVTLSDTAYIFDNSKMNQPQTFVMKLQNGQVTKLGENLPAWARALYSEQLKSFSQARLNPAAASYQDLTHIAQSLSGDDKKVYLPKAKETYSGKVVGETLLHVLQKNNNNGKFYGHFKSIVGQDLKQGQPIEIKYSSSRSATVTSNERYSDLVNTLQTEKKRHSKSTLN